MRGVAVGGAWTDGSLTPSLSPPHPLIHIPPYAEQSLSVDPSSEDSLKSKLGAISVQSILDTLVLIIIYLFLPMTLPHF